MLEMNLSVEVGSAADVVWKIVGNFNGMADWHPLVRASVLEPAEGGVGRRVSIGGDRAGHRELTERLVSFDSSAREYAYTIIAGPVPFTDYVGRFRVVAAGTGRCTLEYHPRWTPQNRPYVDRPKPAIGADAQGRMCCSAFLPGGQAARRSRCAPKR